MKYVYHLDWLAVCGADVCVGPAHAADDGVCVDPVRCVADLATAVCRASSAGDEGQWRHSPAQAAPPARRPVRGLSACPHRLLSQGNRMNAFIMYLAGICPQPTGTSQHSCRLTQASKRVLSSARQGAPITGSRSGFSATASTGDQSRVSLDQRAGLRSFAC